MKPVDQLTDEELRIEIAEFCGWEIQQTDYKTYRALHNGKGIDCKSFDCEGDCIHLYYPNYPSSLDAMWEAEKELMAKSKRVDSRPIKTYREQLLQTCWSKYERETGKKAAQRSVEWWLFHVSAKQRAIAFVKTIREIKR